LSNETKDNYWKKGAPVSYRYRLGKRRKKKSLSHSIVEEIFIRRKIHCLLRRSIREKVSMSTLKKSCALWLPKGLVRRKKTGVEKGKKEIQKVLHGELGGPGWGGEKFAMKKAYCATLGANKRSHTTRGGTRGLWGEDPGKTPTSEEKKARKKKKGFVLQTSTNLDSLPCSGKGFWKRNRGQGRGERAACTPAVEKDDPESDDERRRIVAYRWSPY